MPPDTGQYSPAEVERRYILRREAAEAFIHAVAPRLSLDVYDEVRPVSYTRTTYLDTDDLAYYRSFDGHVMRRVRIREYAAGRDLDDTPTLSGVCVLELKESSGQIRSKARFRSPPHVIAHLVRHRGEAPLLLRQTLDQMQALRALQACFSADLLTPRVTTWYRRASLSGEGGRVRVTLDEGIKFCKPCLIGAPGEHAEPQEIIGYGPGRVIEVKYIGEPPAWLLEAMRLLPEEANFSKFRAGMEALQQAEWDATTSRSTRPIAIPANVRVRKD
jgi:hypothetical protein